MILARNYFDPTEFIETAKISTLIQVKIMTREYAFDTFLHFL